MRGNDLQCFCGRLLVIIGKGAQMDRVRDILLYVVAAFAMFSFACSVYQAMNERNTSAGILAAIAVAGTLLVFFPRLELFKAFGIEARFAGVSITLGMITLQRIPRPAHSAASVRAMPTRPAFDAP